MKNSEPKTKIITTDIREQLKGIVQKEISLLSETMKDLEPKDRLNLVMKLLPFALPKVQSCNMDYGEPLNFGGF